MSSRKCLEPTFCAFPQQLSTMNTTRTYAPPNCTRTPCIHGRFPSSRSLADVGAVVLPFICPGVVPRHALRAAPLAGVVGARLAVPLTRAPLTSTTSLAAHHHHSSHACMHAQCRSTSRRRSDGSRHCSSSRYPPALGCSQSGVSAEAAEVIETKLTSQWRRRAESCMGDSLVSLVAAEPISKLGSRDIFLLPI